MVTETDVKELIKKARSLEYVSKPLAIRIEHLGNNVLRLRDKARDLDIHARKIDRESPQFALLEKIALVKRKEAEKEAEKMIKISNTLNYMAKTHK